MMDLLVKKSKISNTSSSKELVKHAFFHFRLKMYTWLTLDKNARFTDINRII